LTLSSLTEEMSLPSVADARNGDAAIKSATTPIQLITLTIDLWALQRERSIGMALLVTAFRRRSKNGTRQNAVKRHHERTLAESLRACRLRPAWRNGKLFRGRLDDIRLEIGEADTNQLEALLQRLASIQALEDDPHPGTGAAHQHVREQQALRVRGG